jgi:hypothetical protein
VIDIETALLQQLLNIAQRQRIAKIPPDRTKYEAGFGLPPFEDRGWLRNTEDMALTLYWSRVRPRKYRSSR